MEANDPLVPHRGLWLLPALAGKFTSGPHSFHRHHRRRSHVRQPNATPVAVVKTLRGEARLTDDNIQDALREVRLALLEADVALPVVKDFVARVKEKAVGEEVVGSLTPGQALIGVVHRELTALMGGAAAPLDLATQPPAVILLAGPAGRRQDDDGSEARARSCARPEEEGAAGLGRRVSPGGDRAAAHARRAGRRRFLPVDARQAAGGDRARGARLGAAPLPRRADRRHRRPARDRRGDDARDRGAARGRDADRDAVRRRRDAGPGCGEHGAGVPRRAAADRRDPHQARRRFARRRGAVGASRDRRADQVRRRGREDRRARGVPPGAHGVADPRHGRRAVADRGRAEDGRRRGGEEARQEGEVRQGLRPRGLQGADRPDAQDGRALGDARQAAGGTRAGGAGRAGRRAQDRAASKASSTR